VIFGYYSIFVSMLSYTAWHLGKPVPEVWSTLLWGVMTGTIALATRSIWHIIFVHWSLNVMMDLVIWKGW
jgi:membrane protease YdiL (CAAX protease family)